MENIKLSLKTLWQDQLISALADLNVDGHFFLEDHFNLFSIDNQKLIIHFVNLDNEYIPQQLIDLQKSYLAKNFKFVHLWQDVWLNKPTQVLARISSLLGLNKRIHGRKTSIQKIDKCTAQHFLNENHLQGFVSSRYKFGLYEKNLLVAVATFSALRKMNYEENYKSAELIRFAIKSGYSVVGGLSKLIVHFSSLYHPNDLMTYADRDWSAGEAYHKLNFIETDFIKPQFFSLDEEFNRSLKKDNSSLLPTVFNTGSLKYILEF